MLLRLLFLLTLLTCGTICLTAQATSDDPPPKKAYPYKPMKLNLNEDGSAFVRFLTWQQYWAVSDLREGADNRIQSSIRRSRFAFLSKFSPKFQIFMQFGVNSLSANNLDGLGNGGDGPQMFLHDAWGEYNFNKNIQVGYGLHYWQGLSRMSNLSTINLVTLDATRPFVHWNDIGLTNQFARKLGLYAKGTLGDAFNYRVAISDPRVGGGLAEAPSDGTGTAHYGAWALPDGGKRIFEGYFSYSFWDKEGNALPFYVGSYLGGKKILNIGAGFYSVPKGSVSNPSGETLEYHDVTHLSVDAFLELPFGEKGANGMLHAYTAYYNFDYGPNQSNTNVAVRAATGSVLYGELGYLFPGKKVMPYLSYQTRDYQAEGTDGNSVNAGINYFISGHNMKVTGEYHGININEQVNQSQFRLQFHFFM
jgi:hypothetical protein